MFFVVLFLLGFFLCIPWANEPEPVLTQFPGCVVVVAALPFQLPFLLLCCQRGREVAEIVVQSVCSFEKFKERAAFFLFLIFDFYLIFFSKQTFVLVAFCLALLQLLHPVEPVHP